MRNVKLIIEYDGTSHVGWQVQSGRQPKTIQEALEKALERVLQKAVKATSSGRTDSGVHAKAQVANFRTDSPLSCETFKRALNANLPEDISVVKAQEAPLSFHSRFSAKSKLYRYTILNRQARSPLARYFAAHIPYKLDAAAMKKAASYIAGKRDFKSFQATDKKKRPSIRHIKKLSIKRSGDLIYVDIEADGFLYKMVRNIVGTLLEVGRGKIRPEEIKKILSAKDRNISGPTAPARGLCLMEVKY